jgi:hypothetical protein
MGRIRTVAIIAAGLTLAGIAAQLVRGDSGRPRPTRADLDAERRRAAVLESEFALASTRKPYLVLDLGAMKLSYRLMGMTPREIPLPGLRADGLVPAQAAAGTPALAGIFTLREKEGDPRLKPLSPEQVEAGADDENTANILPPEPPKEFQLSFKQPVSLQVRGREEPNGVNGIWTRVSDGWHRLFGSRRPEETRLHMWVVLDSTTAAQLYRSLLPDERWLIVPPEGYVLPAAGQEPPPKPKAARTVPVKPAKPTEPAGVPFRIPPPVDENGGKGNGTDSGNGSDPAGGATAPDPPPPPGGGTQESRYR